MNHEFLVAFSKSWGLFYLIGMTVAVMVYTFWPSNRRRFDDAKRSVLEREDEP